MEKCHRNVWNTSDCFSTILHESSIRFEWHERFKEGRESVRNDERCGKTKKVRTPDLIDQRVTMLRFFREFSKRFRRRTPALFKSAQWHFRQDNTPVHNSILVTDYLTKMGIKIAPQPPYSPDVVPCDFWLFPKFRGCHYETIEEMKEAATKVIDTLTQEDFHGAFAEVVETVEQVHCSRSRLLRKGLEFHVCTINKSGHTKKGWKLF